MYSYMRCQFCSIIVATPSSSATLFPSSVRLTGLWDCTRLPGSLLSRNSRCVLMYITSLARLSTFASTRLYLSSRMSTFTPCLFVLSSNLSSSFSFILHTVMKVVILYITQPMSERVKNTKPNEPALLPNMSFSISYHIVYFFTKVLFSICRNACFLLIVANSP